MSTADVVAVTGSDAPTVVEPVSGATSRDVHRAVGEAGIDHQQSVDASVPALVSRPVGVASVAPRSS